MEYRGKLTPKYNNQNYAEAPLTITFEDFFL